MTGAKDQLSQSHGKMRRTISARAGGPETPCQCRRRVYVCFCLYACVRAWVCRLGIRSPALYLPSGLLALCGFLSSSTHATSRLIVPDDAARHNTRGEGFTALQIQGCSSVGGLYLLAHLRSVKLGCSVWVAGVGQTTNTTVFRSSIRRRSSVRSLGDARLRLTLQNTPIQP